MNVEPRYASAVPNDAMHIVHVVSSLEIGGQERVVLDLAHGLRKRGHRITVVSLAHGGALSRFFKDIPVVSIERPVGFDHELPVRLARVVRDLRADVIHTHNPAAMTYGVTAAKLARIGRVIHTKHGANPPRSRADLALRRALVRACDAYVAVSDPTAEVARRLDRAPERLLRIIPNGIDTALYAHNHERRSALRHWLGIPKEACVLGTVGRLAVEKNQRLFVEAAAAHLTKDTHLVIVGDGPERKKIENSIPQEVREFVHLPGARNDIPAVLSMLDVFVLSSTTEGLPLVVPEAMAAGLPVIATSVGGLPKVVRDRETGILVPPGDARALSLAIGELIDDADLRTKWGAAAVVDAAKRFDLNRVLDDYEALYGRAQGREVGKATA